MRLKRLVSKGGARQTSLVRQAGMCWPREPSTCTSAKPDTPPDAPSYRAKLPRAASAPTAARLLVHIIMFAAWDGSPCGHGSRILRLLAPSSACPHHSSLLITQACCYTLHSPSLLPCASKPRTTRLLQAWSQGVWFESRQGGDERRPVR